jgi:hypothetical protein
LVGTNTGAMNYVAAGVIDQSYPFTIGSGIDSSVVRNYEYFDGKIGEFRIYQKALTSAEVFQNYNASKIKYINEAPDTAPKISNDAIVYDSNLILNYDFKNTATYDNVENLLTNSYKNGTNWFKQQVTVEANAAIAPDGTKTATLLTENDVTAFHFIGSGAVTSGPRTFSAYCKAGTTNRATLFITQSGNNGARFNLETGQVITVLGTGNTAAIEDCGNGWYRCSVANDGVAAEPDDQVRIGTFNGATNSEAPASPLRSIYVWGPQVERKLESPPLAGRYIKTYGVAINRQLAPVKNLSSSSNTGTINGAKFNSDGYFEFDGSNDGISVPDTNDFPLGTNDFTMEFWGYMDSLPGSGNEYGMVGQDGIGSDAAAAIYWKNDGGTMKVIFRMGGLGSMEPAASLSAGQWIYCACGRRSGTTFVNVNGVDISTSSGFSGSLNNSTNPLYIGRSNFSNKYLDGRIGEVRVYNRGLSSSEVSQNFEATRSKYGV